MQLLKLTTKTKANKGKGVQLYISTAVIVILYIVLIADSKVYAKQRKRNYKLNTPTNNAKVRKYNKKLNKSKTTSWFEMQANEQKKKNGNNPHSDTSQYAHYKSLYRDASRDAEYMYRQERKVKIRDLYAEQYDKTQSYKKHITKALKAMSFHRRKLEIILLAGIGVNASYIHSDYPTTSVNQEFTNSFLNVNPGLSGNLTIFTKLSKSTSLELFADYFLMMPYGFNTFVNPTIAPNVQGEQKFDAVHRVHAGAIFGINTYKFGKAKANQLTTLIGLEGLYYNGSNFYNQNLGFTYTDSTLPGDQMGTTMRGINNFFGISVMGGIRLGMMYGNRHRLMIDLLAAIGPSLFRDTAAIETVINTNFQGMNAGLYFNLQHHTRINENLWLVIALRNKVLFSLIDTNGSVSAITKTADGTTQNILGMMELNAGILMSF